MSLEASLHVGLSMQLPEPGASLAGRYFFARDTQELYLCDGTTWAAVPLSVVFGPSGAGHGLGIVPDPGATAGTSKFLREDGAWSVPLSGPGGGGGALAVVSYASSSDSIIASPSTSFTDVDATHLAVTFEAPSSGNVVVRVTGILYTQGDADYGYFDLREGGADISGTSRALSIAVQVLSTLAWYLTGLAGGSHTLTLGFRTGASSTAAKLQLGPTYGAVTFEVWAA
jgi:hypothetical protein